LVMNEDTIINSSNVGKRLDGIVKDEQLSYLMFNKERIPLVSAITIGRARGNSVVIGGMLASRHHAVIQKIMDDYFIKDLESTNGTLVNGERIPNGKYVKLSPGDTITIGKMSLVMQ
jgi:pSer/pThr/pTyr-binding forkhead associated (FHA) protein